VKSCLIPFFAGICFIFAVQTSSAQTLAVGNCRPGLVSYLTISAAVAAAAPGATVLVCPGTYPEQVVITQSLTLRGLSMNTFTPPVIAVPSGGLISNLAGDAIQLSVQATAGPVNIYSITVDGAGSSFTCSTVGASLVGIEYLYTSGSLVNVKVRNQLPGGCGVGISLSGSPSVVDTVNILHSSITNFDNTGILATYDDSNIGFIVNLDANSLSSASASVFAGVDYEGPDGLVQRNTVAVSGQYGLMLENFFGGLTAQRNKVTGAMVGIRSGADEASVTNIVGNNVIDSGIGIQVIGPGTGASILSNFIARSSTIAIDVNCSELVVANNNIIFGAPVGIANLAGENPTGNIFYHVPIKTTPC
jgi:hypothetical protein